MPQTVIISSVNFSGEQANIMFTPTGSNESFGLGTQLLPYTFDSSSINKDIYGTYSLSIINNDLIEEKSAKNDYVSQISDVSETDEIIINDEPQKAIIGESTHLFDKLSKSGNVATSGGSIKQIQINNEIPNIVRPVIIPDNRPPEIKEIFIGKQNNSSNPNFYSLKPKENRHNGLLIRNKLHNSDKTNSLYKKKYDEYVKNSQINSSSINNTALSSVKSNSKTIVLEDASEYISDNIEF